MKYAALGLVVLFSFPVMSAQAETFVFDTSDLAYSPEHYPSAQGHYLVAPQTQQVAAVAPVAQPTYVAPVAQPSYVSAPVVVQSQTYAAAPQKTVVAQPLAYAPRKPTVISLGTTNGFEFGGQGSWYRYQEHVVANQTFMHIDGGMGGLTVDANKVFSDGTYIGGNIRGAYGRPNYHGGDVNLLTGATIPSKHDNEDNVLLEGRLVAGHDFIFDQHTDSPNFSLSPYTGAGIRFLMNDGTGPDSNGVDGYHRFSQYIYLPVGVTPRFRVSDTSRLSLNAEYDQLLYGWQSSSLQDFQPGAQDLVNHQYNGFGLRGSLMYEMPSWSIGPFFNYWNIDQSHRACAQFDATHELCGVEPHNQTMEYGLQLRYRLDMPW